MKECTQSIVPPLESTQSACGKFEPFTEQSIGGVTGSGREGREEKYRNYNEKSFNILQICNKSIILCV